MKIKLKQSVYVVDLKRTVGAGEEVEIKNEAVAKSLVEVGYAEEVIKVPSEDEVVEPVKEEVKPKRRRKKEDGE